MLFCAFLDPKRYSRLNLKNHSTLLFAEATALFASDTLAQRLWAQLIRSKTSGTAWAMGPNTQLAVRLLPYLPSDSRTH